MIHHGRCHCGNLEYELETALTPEALPLRACQCSFCRGHGALSTSDPRGSVAIRAQDPSLVQRYRFGLGITDFLICRRCGVYLLAMMQIDGAYYAVLSANVLDCRERMGPAQAMDYEGEDEAGRMARRKARWTPVTALRGL